MLPCNFYEQAEFKQLHQVSTGNQERNALALWVRALACAARLAQDGLIGYTTDQPLTPTDFTALLGFDRVTRVQPLLDVLADCDLIKQAADQHYYICHWQRYTVAPEVAAQYHGLIKFDTADEAPLAAPATELTQITPLALQDYTPEQRLRLAASTQKILAYLHQQSGKEFAATDAVQILLAGLFSQKVTMKQIKQVIDWKIKDWYGGDYWKYLRPQTLFGPKFKQYLLEAPPAPYVKQAAQTRAEYLQAVFTVCSGDIALAIRRATDEGVTTDQAELEAIGHALGH